MDVEWTDRLIGMINDLPVPPAPSAPFLPRGPFNPRAPLPPRLINQSSCPRSGFTIHLFAFAEKIQGRIEPEARRLRAKSVGYISRTEMRIGPADKAPETERCQIYFRDSL